MHSSVWEDNEPVLVVSSDETRMRVAGINAVVAWITEGWTSPIVPEEPISILSVREAANRALAQIHDRRLTAMIRPKLDEEPRLIGFILNPEGLPERSPLSPDPDASADLLTMLANLPGRWPEVAACIERDRARLGLPPLGPAKS